jgi:hypothetical protein
MTSLNYLSVWMGVFCSVMGISTFACPLIATFNYVNNRVKSILELLINV